MIAFPAKAQKLAALAASPRYALEIGKAAEHLVCADLILSGYRCFLSDQGLPYDVVVDVAGRLIRVQVKASCFARNVNASGRSERMAYSFGVRAAGKGNRRRLSNDACDLVALVALDIGVIAYLPISVVGQTAQIPPPGTVLTTKFKSLSQWARTIDEFPFEAAISGDMAFYSRARRRLTHCVHGHEYTEDNTTRLSNGGVSCRACSRLRYLRKVRQHSAVTP